MKRHGERTTDSRAGRGPAAALMAAVCPVPAPGGPMVAALIEFVDCQAQALGTLGYRALATPGSSVALATTGLLVIFVALFGYRMLLGEAPDLRTAVVALVRVGVVLMLGTSWAAWSVLVYDTAVHLPVELAAEIGQPLGLPGSNGDMVAAVQDMADQLARLRASGLAPRLIFLVSTLGTLLALRIVAGLLLAAGPLFVAFLLFDATRGLLAGWVRALGWTALAMVLTLLLLGIEIAVLAPAVAEALAAQRRLAPPPHGSLYLLTLAFLFALAILAGLLACARLAAGFRFPPALWPSRNSARERLSWTANDSDSDGPASSAVDRPAIPAASTSRAAVVGAALRTAERRDATASQAPGTAAAPDFAGHPATAVDRNPAAAERGSANRRGISRSLRPSAS